MENLRAAGCSEVVIIVGYKAEMINYPVAQYVYNRDYATNNQLHSLMKAREKLVGPVIVSFCDIWTEPWVYSRLIETPGDIVLAVDQDWQPYYDGRSDHPVSQADKVYVNPGGAVSAIGKHLDPNNAVDQICGEFIGLWRMSAAGTDRFVREFDALNARLSAYDSFQMARGWLDAYITHMMQQLVDQGQRVDCALIERGWAEFDTEQDIERLPKIVELQRLTTLLEGN
jgi:choline kinase